MTEPKGRPHHDVLLSHEEKVKWFTDNIKERQRVRPFETEEDLLAFLRVLRRNFKDIYDRDVPGYFIRKIAGECGVHVEVAPKTRLKMNYAFSLMDENQHFRDNKTELAKALESHFGEKTLNYIVDDIWEEWHDRHEHPEPKVNVDLAGQEPLFDD